MGRYYQEILPLCAIVADDLRKGPDPILVRGAYKKRKQGLALTSEERQALSLAQKEYSNRRTLVYFESEEQMAEWQARAQAAQYTSFSQWIVDQVQRAQLGSLIDPVAHGRLEEKLQRLQQDVQYERSKSGEFEAENRELRGEVRRLTAEVAEAATWIRQKFGSNPSPPKQTTLKGARDR